MYYVYIPLSDSRGGGFVSRDIRVWRSLVNLSHPGAPPKNAGNRKYLKRFQLFFGWIFSGWVEQKQGSITLKCTWKEELVALQVRFVHSWVAHYQKSSVVLEKNIWRYRGLLVLNAHNSAVDWFYSTVIKKGLGGARRAPCGYLRIYTDFHLRTYTRWMKFWNHIACCAKSPALDHQRSWMSANGKKIR